jgi:hypothetical protein
MRHFTVAIIALLIPATALAAGECRKDRRLPSQPVDPTNEAHPSVHRSEDGVSRSFVAKLSLSLERLK